MILGCNSHNETFLIDSWIGNLSFTEKTSACQILIIHKMVPISSPSSPMGESGHFGEVVNGEMMLNDAGKMIDKSNVGANLYYPLLLSRDRACLVKHPVRVGQDGLAIFPTSQQGYMCSELAKNAIFRTCLARLGTFHILWLVLRANSTLLWVDRQ